MTAVIKATKYIWNLWQGTPERLIQHLIEDNSVIDPTYVEDFLLTYRTFLKTPVLLTNKLLQWFEDPAMTDKVRVTKQNRVSSNFYIHQSRHSNNG